MVVIRSVNEIILNLIDFFKTAQPNLDTKPGTVARDLVIDAPANQLALLYDQISQISNLQSLRLVVGSDLDKLGKNFGLTRKQATPSSGVALLTFTSVPSSIAIDKGDVITATNGFSFQVTNGVSVLASQLNFYKSVATQYQNDLTFVGISDQYAVQVSVQATTPGSAGDIAKYALTSTTIAGVSNVTNVNTFSGGNDQEDDATFRNRILSVFSGSSVGTALGYKNTALATTGVQDAYVVEPGDPLMTRDGSVVTSDSAGNLTIVTEGTGGKVDIVILGNNISQSTDSYIYRDLSNTNDPTNTKNIFVLGQIVADANKTFNQKRISDIAAGTLPTQPVNLITQVSGSGSGSNFTPKVVDSLGRVSGNYELIPDTSVYAGSPWGFDSFHWISNQVVFNEDKVKGQFGGQDALTYSDVIQIPQVQQSVSITNENSTVLTSNRSLIQLLHTPATNVTRVFNVNSGERYTVVNQNPNGSSTTNTSGIVQISGSTLPSQSDVLQVDYNWLITYDQYLDYDGRYGTNNVRSVTDSIDWGYSNLVRNERVNFNRTNSTIFTGNASLPITSLVNAYQFTELDGYVSTVTSGTFTGRYAVVLSNLLTTTNSIENVHWKNTTVELFDTSQANGLYTNATVVVGITLEYVTTIILPTDTKAVPGDSVTVTLNSTDLFNINNSNGSFTGNQITIPVSNFATTTANNIVLHVNYVANTQYLINTGITSIPLSRIGNGFIVNNSNGFNNTYPNIISRRENQVVQKNSSNQFYIELGLSVLDSTLTAYKVETIIRLSDGLELWNRDFTGTITTNTANNNYQLILTGHNTPVLGDRTLVIYSSVDNQRFQPFTFSNKIIQRDFNSLQFNSTTNAFSFPIHNFVAETGISFQILEPNTDVILASGTDGYLTSNGLTANFFSNSTNFGGLTDSNNNPITINFKKIRLLNCTNVNNNNMYDIKSSNASSNFLVIGNDFSKLNNNQISVIRVLDGKELWSDSGVLNVSTNTITFPATSNANPSDLVYVSYMDIANLRQSPTKLSITLTDQVVNSGTLSVVGTTISKATDIVFSATSTSLTQNLLSAIRLATGLSSSASIPANIKLVKIAKLERVTTDNTSVNNVLLVKTAYDLEDLIISNNVFFSDTIIKNSTLGNFDFILPATTNNTTNLSAQVSSGDKFRVTFYYATTNNQENVVFTKNGTLYTNNNFALVDKIFISSGFTASQSAKITVANFNQPIAGSRYTAYYTYVGPKPNERIIIQYNYNKLISDTTFNVESNRPINADVLVRAAKSIELDVIIDIVITSQYASSSALIIQNVQDKITSVINALGLGSYIDSSSLVSAAFTVQGVGAARTTYFNETGTTGSVLNIQAHNDQYFVANTITVTQVAT